MRGQSDIVGPILSDIENPFVPPLVESFDRACAAAGLELLLGMTNYEQGKAEAAVRRMIESRVRGVAVMTSQIDGRLLDAFIQAGIPVVALDAAKTGRGCRSLSILLPRGRRRGRRSPLCQRTSSRCHPTRALAHCLRPSSLRFPAPGTGLRPILSMNLLRLPPR